MAKHCSLIRPEVSPPLPVLMGSRQSSGLTEASEWCQKHSMDPATATVHRREKARSEILGEPVVAVHEDEAQEEEVDDDMSPFKRGIENWSTLTESFTLPIQPFCPTLRTIPEDALEGNEDHKPSCTFSQEDILVHCYGCYDDPELTDDKHFNMTPVPWRLQIWVRGSNDSIAVHGLHEQPI